MKGKATREAYGEVLKVLGEKNQDIVVLDADLSKSTKTAVFASKFPERFVNVGISEQNLMGISAGIATTGKIPFASTFAMFATGRAYEIVRNSIGYPGLNVKIAATHAGLTVGEDGATHQSIEDMSLMRGIPNMVVINPADELETREAVIKASEHIGPVYIRLGRSKVPNIFDEKEYSFEIGKGIEIIKGNDVTIIATGVMVSKAIEASKILKEKNIKARIINMHTIKPIDKDIIVKAAKETKAIVTVEEHSILGGLGSAVSEVVSDLHPTVVKRIGIKDTFGESGNGEELLEKYGLNVENIVKTTEMLMK